MWAASLHPLVDRTDTGSAMGARQHLSWGSPDETVEGDQGEFAGAGAAGGGAGGT